MYFYAPTAACSSDQIPVKHDTVPLGDDLDGSTGGGGGGSDDDMAGAAVTGSREKLSAGDDVAFVLGFLVVLGVGGVLLGAGIVEYAFVTVMGVMTVTILMAILCVSL